MQALQAATLKPARFLGREKDLGTVETGKLADLVLLDANPLDDIGNTKKIEAVIYRGQYYPRTSLDEMLAHAEAMAGRKSIAQAMMKTIQEKDATAAGGVCAEGLSWSQVCARLKLSKGTALRAFYSLPNHPQESATVSA
jgi:adenine deaminase